MSPRIFIVEDEAIIATDIAHRVERFGLEVVGIAARGEDAVMVAHQSQPDAVLMDIRLAGKMNGIAAAEQIQKSCGAAIIFLTAYSETDIRKKANLTMTFTCISKPFEDRDLQIALDMAIAKPRES